MIVKAKGMNMSMTLNLFGIGPKFTLQCSCGYGWRQRVIPGVDNPLIVCPHCGESDRLPFTWKNENGS